ncbi:MAG: hypothetical protein LJE91_03650 [Gammaproteobacteria bacterium]|nr:hypothetical protein [Gammaproteobacteria bacterium]
MTAGTVINSLEPSVLQASKAIYDQLSIPFGDTTIKLLALADGYALLSDPGHIPPHELEAFLATLIRYKKTILLDNADQLTLLWLRDFCRRYARMEIVEVEAMQPRLLSDAAGWTDTEHPVSSRVLAIFPHGFLRRRAVLQRAQEYQVLQAGQDTLPRQAVHIIGIGPNRSLLTRRAADLIGRARLVVTFDFVYEIIEHLPFQGQVIVLDYDWQTYPVNIERIDQRLALLHVEGHYDVTVVVEGNPEVYDLLAFLSLSGRDYRFEVMAPAVTLCCAWLTEHYGMDVTYPSYVIVSGYNARLGITTAQLALELDAYLRLEMTCLVIELYSGDLPLVFQRVQHASRPKFIVILMNIFTPEQQIYVVDASSMNSVEWARQIKGKFTSFAIVDAQRLRRSPDVYARLLRDFAPVTEPP